jgi:hypothetical protein
MRITAIHTRLMRIPFTELLRAAYGARTHGPLAFPHTSLKTALSRALVRPEL